MFLRGICISFVLEHLQSVDEFGTRVARLDDLIDVATTGGNVGIGKLLDVLRDQFFSSLFGIRCSLDLILKKDVDGTFWTHHGDLCGGPGVVDIAAHMLATHHIVSTAIRFARDNRDLGDGSLTLGEEQFGTTADNTVVLLSHPW